MAMIAPSLPIILAALRVQSPSVCVSARTRRSKQHGDADSEEGQSDAVFYSPILTYECVCSVEASVLVPGGLEACIEQGH